MDIVNTINIFLTFATTVALAIGGWALKSTIDLRERMAVMESNRFTSEQAGVMKAEMRQEIQHGFDRVMRCIRQMQRGEDCDDY